LLGRRGSEQGFGIGDVDGAGGDHQFDGFDLAFRTHFAQHAGHFGIEVLVAQQHDRPCRHPFEQIHPFVDGADVEVEGAGQAFLANAAVDGPAQHVVLLNRREAVDAIVVGVGFVVLGQQAGGFGFAQLFEHQHPHVAVEQEKFFLVRIGLGHRKRLDQADFLNRGPDLGKLARAHGAIGHFLAWQEDIEGNRLGFEIKTTRMLRKAISITRLLAGECARRSAWAGCPAPRRAAG
jgi:hypothetical protein